MNKRTEKNAFPASVARKAGRRQRFGSTVAAACVLALGFDILMIPGDSRTHKDMHGAPDHVVQQIRSPAYSTTTQATQKTEQIASDARRLHRPQTATITIADDRDAVYRGLMVGRWERELLGKRTMTVRDDGTATVIFLPKKFWTLLFGNRLRIELDWRIERGSAIYRVRTGSPKAEFARAKKYFGDRWAERILELDEKRLLLLNEDTSTSLWTRLTD